jgi:L-alanine-DL-glutamate epimerase-like enolase superfamily enzyme
MKITDVSLTLFTWEDIPTASYGKHTGVFGGTADLGLLTIKTDEGVEGHSFLGSAYQPASSDGASLIKVLKPILMGQDPLDRERLGAAMQKRNGTYHTTARAVGTVDIALWDIAGKVANLPIHRLLGTYRTQAPAYAASPVFDTIEEYVDEASKCKAENWLAYKIHPPMLWRKDIAICEAVRKAVGDDYTLMLDSMYGYNYMEALRVGRAIEELDYYWYEDPLSIQDHYNYPKLREKLDVPIMATEQAPGGLDAYAPFILSRATDYLRGNVRAGITTLVRAAHLAEAFRMNYEVHHGGNALHNVASLHVVMALRNTEFFEVLLPRDAHMCGVHGDIEIDKNGYVHAMNAPGLGADIDFDLIKRKKIAVLG